MKAILDTKPQSAYDDEIASRYHFPPRYLSTISKCIGDWVIFRSPRAAGTGIAYIGVGRITSITPDPTKPGYNYAEIDDFLFFDDPVAWRVDGRYAEAALREIENVSTVGLYLRGKSVREVGEEDFAAIVESGFSDTLDPTNATIFGLEADDVDASTWELLDPHKRVVERRIAKILVNRKIRDASFRRAVCVAYGNRCAITGLKIVNSKGQSEVQAAHILPVESDGPDIVQNGIALSATVHWLFDNHLISLDHDYRLLVSNAKIPHKLRDLFVPFMKPILLPNDTRLWPLQKYMAIHRQQFSGK